VSESDGVSDGDGSRQTTLFRLSEGPRRAFDASRLVLDLVASFLFELPQQNFCKINSLFSLLFQHEYLSVRSGLAQGWYLMFGEPQQKWTAKKSELNDGRALVFTKAGWFTGAASVSSEARGKSWGLKMFLSQAKRSAARKPLPAISPVAARL